MNAFPSFSRQSKVHDDFMMGDFFSRARGQESGSTSEVKHSLPLTLEEIYKGSTKSRENLLIVPPKK